MENVRHDHVIIMVNFSYLKNKQSQTENSIYQHLQLSSGFGIVFQIISPAFLKHSLLKHIIIGDILF